MKMWLLVLLVSFQITIIESETDGSQTFNLEDPDSMVKTRNNDRKKAAEEKNFAAMWKLEWSDELLQKIKTLPNDCNALTPGSGYRFELIAQGRPSAEWAHREGLYMLHHNPDVLQHSTAFTQERYQPSQKQIACAEYKLKNSRLQPEKGHQVQNVKKKKARTKTDYVSQVDLLVLLSSLISLWWPQWSSWFP
ncbi:hypothetical protein CAEBREN_19797 [Caenorhabditis brenneri]|uniref:SCP domain-containing protein n=1 Tax=Caenorhabditis brenneri TaxID=135651 RepID=G0PHE0_CAEBE|nr:hypothetical protein CAEBREN_19797 [Caenorhabditis brenneri]